MAEHNQIAERDGRVLLAKFGGALSATHIKRMRGQLQRETPVFLILATRIGSHFQGYAAPVATFFIGAPPADLHDLIPRYYSEMQSAPGLWILLRGIFVEHSLEPYLLASNKRRLIDVLGIARTPAMLVEATAGQDA